MTKSITIEDYNEEDIFTISRLLSRGRIIIISGAGISVSAGIPDFRSSNGLYDRKISTTSNKSYKGKEMFDINFFHQSHTRPIFYQFIAELKKLSNKAIPTVTHQFLERLCNQNQAIRWYTQNIDCLESRDSFNSIPSLSLSLIDVDKDIEDASLSSSFDNIKLKNANKNEKIVYLHGKLDSVYCTKCHSHESLNKKYLEIYEKGQEPSCPQCKIRTEKRADKGLRSSSLTAGIMRPDIVLYNELHPNGDDIAQFIREDLRKSPTILLVLGTSLKVHGLKKMVKDFSKHIHSNENKTTNSVIYINKTPLTTLEWKQIFDWELIGPADDWTLLLKNQLTTQTKIESFFTKQKHPTKTILDADAHAHAKNSQELKENKIENENKTHKNSSNNETENRPCNKGKIISTRKQRQAEQEQCKQKEQEEQKEQDNKSDKNKKSLNIQKNIDSIEMKKKNPIVINTFAKENSLSVTV